MCGINGVVSIYKNGLTDDHVKAFEDMLISGSVRGMDGTGVIRLGVDQNCELRKMAATPIDLLRAKAYDGFHIPTFKQSFMALVGHNRYATRGKLIPAHTHPFKADHIVMVHNGTLYQTQDLPNDKDGKPFEVDSEALCHGVAKWGLQETVNKVYGAIATVFFDTKEKKLHLYRNSQRPLAIARHPNFSDWLFASEIEMLRWVVARRDLKGFTIENLKDNEHIEIDTQTGDYKSEQIERKYTYTPPIFPGFEEFDDFGSSCAHTSTTTQNDFMEKVQPTIVKDSVVSPKEQALLTLLKGGAAGKGKKPTKAQKGEPLSPLKKGNYRSVNSLDGYSVGDDILWNLWDFNVSAKKDDMYTVEGGRGDLINLTIRGRVLSKQGIDNLMRYEWVVGSIAHILLDLSGTTQNHIIWVNFVRGSIDPMLINDEAGKEIAAFDLNNKVS